MIIFDMCPNCGHIIFSKNLAPKGDLFFHCEHCGEDIDPCEMSSITDEDIKPDDLDKALQRLISLAQPRLPSNLMPHASRQDLVHLIKSLIDELSEGADPEYFTETIHNLLSDEDIKSLQLIEENYLLPTTVVIPTAELMESADCEDIEELEDDDISDYLSDKYSFCINSFQFTIEPDNTTVTDIDWDLSD